MKNIEEIEADKKWEKFLTRSKYKSGYIAKAKYILTLFSSMMYETRKQFGYIRLRFLQEFADIKKLLSLYI